MTCLLYLSNCSWGLAPGIFLLLGWQWLSLCDVERELSACRVPCMPYLIRLDNLLLDIHV